MEYFYTLDGKDFYEQNTVLNELNKLIRKNKKFTINYSMYDEEFVEELFNKLRKNNVKAEYIQEGKDLLKDEIIWTVSDGIGGELLTITTEQGAKYLYEKAGEEALADIFLKIVTEGGKVVLELDPYVGIVTRIIGGVAGIFIGDKLGSFF